MENVNARNWKNKEILEKKLQWFNRNTIIVNYIMQSSNGAIFFTLCNMTLHLLGGLANTVLNTKMVIRGKHTISAYQIRCSNKV